MDNTGTDVLPTADELRSMANDVIQAERQQELTVVVAQLRKLAAQGEYVARFPGLRSHTVLKLKEAGYDVKTQQMSVLGETEVVVSW